MRDYSFSEARTVLREMADASCLDLCSKGLSCGSISVHVGYARPRLAESGRWGMGSGGSTKLSERTDSPHRIVKVALELFDKHTLNGEPIRRLTVALGALQPAKYDQPSLFGRRTAAKKPTWPKRPGCRARPLCKNALLQRYQFEAGRNHARTQQPNRRPPCLAKTISWKTLPSARQKGAAATAATLQCGLGKTASTSLPTAPNEPPQFMPFAALTGFEELMAEKEADAAKFNDFAGAQVFDTP